MPLITEAPLANSRPPDLGGPGLIAKVKYRPLGKSVYRQCPWSPGSALTDAYVPSAMAESSLKIGLSKHSRIIPLLDEKMVIQTEEILEDELKAIWTNTPEDNVISYQESLSSIKRDKSPGFPYFYNYQSKGEVLEDIPEVITDRVGRLMAGEKLPCIFSLTEKSELRPIEKVKLGKTRVFMASPIDHLLACTQLFTVQNQQIIDTIGQHPITIGIQIPGNQFVRFVSKFKDRCNDGDVDGCDLGFHPRVARSIRNIRMKSLPMKFWRAIIWLYATVYAGCAVGCGGMYRVRGNKSGWFNTGHDNSLMVWWYLIYGCLKFYPGEYWKDVIMALINGDDVFLRYKGDFKAFCEYLASQGCIIECENWVPRHPKECVFLSHHLEERYVSGFGDFILAAGNLPKLLCSVNWVKRCPSLTFEESCVAHLIGLRICLFPWQIHFNEVDSILSSYLKGIVLTPFIKSCLKARFTELELAYLNTRYESFSFFFHNNLKQVLKGKPACLKECSNAQTQCQSQKCPKEETLWSSHQSASGCPIVTTNGAAPSSATCT